jgi:hypothetical protein
MPAYEDFRAQLDAVLRQRDPQALRRFLISAGQWSEDVPEFPEQQMWMMIAGSPNLSDLHEEARAWLVAHGLGEQAELILRRHTDQAAREKRRPQNEG